VPDAPASKKLDPADRKLIIWWCVDIGLLCLLAAFCLLLVRPFLLARHVLESDWGWRGYPEGVRALGGPEPARRALAIYLRFPEQVASSKKAAMMMLGYCGPNALPEMERALNRYSPADLEACAGWSGDWRGASSRGSAAEMAVSALCAQGRAGVPLLAKSLGHFDPEVRERAARMLWILGPDAPEAVPELLRIAAEYQEPDRERWPWVPQGLKWYAARAAIAILEVRPTEALIAGLQDPDPKVRAKTVAELYRLARRPKCGTGSLRQIGLALRIYAAESEEGQP